MPQDFAEIARSALLTIAALMPIVNPIGSAPIFLSMSADLPAPARHQLSRKVAWRRERTSVVSETGWESQRISMVFLV